MIKIYDSKLKKKVEFESLKEGAVSMYVCGPTVYDRAHLGHGRSAVCFDVIRKYFEYKGLEVKFVSNYTDIDDKMINRANKEGISVEELAGKTIPIYESEYGKLGIKKPDVMPKATQYIKEMVEMIKQLEDKGYTYALDDGIYYSVEKFPKYGELSGQKMDELKAGARVEVKAGKQSPSDFVLWKFKKEGEPSWESPWGEGRPGWHIECSAMSLKELGKTFDIHGGGLDLKFPHHECEIAQSVGALGEGRFAKYWLHNGFINIDNEKMSKSLGNFFTLEEIFKKYNPLLVRLMFLQTHYRNPINFNEGLLEQAKGAFERLHAFVRRLDREGEEGKEYEFLGKFEECMNNDFDTSGALGVVFDLVKEVNKDLDAGEVVNGVRLFEELVKVDHVLGVVFPEKEEEIDEEVEALIKEREEARERKDFKRADEIREKLGKMGVVVEDGEGGVRWRRV